MVSVDCWYRMGCEQRLPVSGFTLNSPEFAALQQRNSTSAFATQRQQSLFTLTPDVSCQENANIL